VYPFGEVIHYTDRRIDTPVDRIQEDVRAFLVANGFADASVELLAPTVEDTFIARTAAGDAQSQITNHKSPMGARSSPGAP
jgi:hypothetical protein